jgi:hypothetical protein
MDMVNLYEPMSMGKNIRQWEKTYVNGKKNYGNLYLYYYIKQLRIGRVQFLLFLLNFLYLKIPLI